MTPNSELATRRTQRTADLPGYIFHPSFADKTAKTTFDSSKLLEEMADYSDNFMPDDITREHAKCMHYAAHRMHQARTAAELSRWHKIYLTLRDRIVLGNRKLVYRAVRRKSALANRLEDTVSDCQIVLIQAVCAYNPWLGIRFSTYAFTCILRAISRLSQRQSSDWLTRTMSLDALPDGEPLTRRMANEPSLATQIPIEDYLRQDHPLLSEREKLILAHRFTLHQEPSKQTLEKVGHALGLSKERVRQVEAVALGKLRRALTQPCEV